VLLTVLAALWALRLGGHLVYRIYHTGHDRRFDKIKKSLPTFFFAWTMQARTVRAMLC
jgi:steroid 5-alpha reductase family enzyme